MLPHYVVKHYVRKQAINNKLQGSVATCIRYGGGCLIHFVRLATTLLKVEENARCNPPFCR